MEEMGKYEDDQGKDLLLKSKRDYVKARCAELLKDVYGEKVDFVLLYLEGDTGALMASNMAEKDAHLTVMSADRWLKQNLDRVMLGDDD